MPRWGLLVEQNLGLGGQRRVWSAEVLDEVDGTREEALEALRVRAEGFVPVHPHRPRRRRLSQQHDGFLLVLDGSWQSFHCRFTLGERLLDSAAPPVPDPAPEEPEAAPAPPSPRPARPRPEPEPESTEPPAEWDADVPEVPSWYGRQDLS